MRAIVVAIVVVVVGLVPHIPSNLLEWKSLGK